MACCAQREGPDRRGRRAGHASRAVAADLTSEADIANIRATLSAEDPRVTFLVNAAGFGKFGDWQTISDARWIHDRPELPRLVDMTRATLPIWNGQPHHPGGLREPQSAALRLIGKVVPSCITMAGWDVLRRL